MRIFMGFCVEFRDTPEHARVPVPMVSSGETSPPRLIQWREDTASRRSRVLVAASSDKASPAARQESEMPPLRMDSGKELLPDQQAGIRGTMIDILV